MSFSTRLLKVLRTFHLYLGAFAAPALLFFAFTGALQTLDLHEAARGSDYKPPAWLVSLSHLHKKQSLDVPARHPRSPQMATTQADDHAARARGVPAQFEPQRNTWPMKIYFVLIALALFLSTLTGVYMASRHTRHRRSIVAAFVAGIVVPALLLLF